ncbi:MULTISPECIES: Ger(x)C family spore germination protein [Brevibacillus]|uniref:Ger(x)C family spore germination protein n=1 Tax=Brevibacillus TaxID=55080 RepID=UPI000D0F6C81|nr:MULTISPECIES: Ger(x)C family spore germination protein [Brevibacillus]MED1948456.1 Ger(x)C family spore germination protein [Brevibacillus formosus]MED1997697.1 Ger(x)C family spore germination protein [Brevibacillus formosus]MED2083733.1 Ger(x)C family spore germination protein [Brevibacillus formosus]PSK16007.1 Ger(x)C family spore germination protein [Brevibacillus sp. NRRL NRS-603]
MYRCQSKGWLIGKRGFTLLLVLIFSVTGCSNRQIFDETGLVTLVGYDLTKDRQIRATIVMPSINPEAKEKMQIMSDVGETSKGIRDKTNLQSDKRVLAGQLRVALYGKDMAKAGIGSLIDTLYRDPSLSSRIFLCVYEGETYELLTYPYKSQGNIGTYMYRMIDQNIRGEKIPSSTIHEFIRAYYDEGIDSQMPYVSRKGDEIVIKGVALFKGDKYIDWISPNEAFILKLIRGKYKTGSYEISVPAKTFNMTPNSPAGEKEEVQLVFDTINSESKVQLEQADPPKFKVNIHLKARILELTVPIKLDNPSLMRKMEEALEKELERQARIVMKKLQDLEVDPTGFGIVYKANVRRKEKMAMDEWREKYKKARFEFQVEATVTRNGVMD